MTNCKVRLPEDEMNILLDAFKPAIGAQAMKANLKAGGYWLLLELDIKITYEKGNYYMQNA